MARQSGAQLKVIEVTPRRGPSSERKRPSDAPGVVSQGSQRDKRIRPDVRLGDPVVMGPNHLRIDVDAFNAQYAVDVIIGKGCRVLSVSTNLETNPSP